VGSNPTLSEFNEPTMRIRPKMPEPKFFSINIIVIFIFLLALLIGFMVILYNHISTLQRKYEQKTKEETQGSLPSKIPSTTTPSTPTPQPIGVAHEDKYIKEFAKAEKENKQIDTLSTRFVHYLQASLSTPPSECLTPSFPTLIQNPDLYRGKRVKFKGRLMYFITFPYRPHKEWGLDIDTIYWGSVKEEEGGILHFYTAKKIPFKLIKDKGRKYGGRQVYKNFVEVKGTFIRISQYRSLHKKKPMRQSVVLIADTIKEIPQPTRAPSPAYAFTIVVVLLALLLLGAIFVAGLIMSRKEQKESFRMKIRELRKRKLEEKTKGEQKGD
jgi:predicted Holliday junction resolvase-like endonuclease